MFRKQPGIADGPVGRTFESIKRVLEPTLYAGYYSMYITGSLTNLIGELHPVPFFFAPGSLAESPAWVRGALDVRHFVAAIEQSGGGGTTTVTVDLVAAVMGAAPDVLSTVVLSLPLTAVAAKDGEYLESVDLSGYEVIGMRYTTDAAPTDPFMVSSALLWRPEVA